MGEHGVGALRGMRVLVVEDEPLVSMALGEELDEAGAMTVGPAASVEGALDLIAGGPVDTAILDVELQGKSVYAVADLLVGRGVPFILTTGHDAEFLPGRYAEVPNCSKPAPTMDVLSTLATRIVSH
jgi:DNA-binding NarL/FixJ family response regulator